MPPKTRLTGPHNDALVYTALNTGSDRAAFFRSLKHLKSQLSHKPPLSPHELHDLQRLQELGARLAHLEAESDDAFAFASPEVSATIGCLKTWQTALGAFGDPLARFADDPRAQFTYVVACLFLRLRKRLANPLRQTSLPEPPASDPESFLPVTEVFW